MNRFFLASLLLIVSLILVLLLIYGMITGFSMLTEPESVDVAETELVKYGIADRTWHNRNLQYATFDVDGMPCIIVGRKNGGVLGVSCDWDKRGEE